MRTKSRGVVQNQPANFDEVRRRFIRQNRELAKNNSNQSLRIRSLELEVSRLLGENLDLREQVLQLQNEADVSRSGQVSGAAMRSLRGELQTKLAELSGLVDGMDALAHGGSETQVAQRERKPIEGNWRERQPLTEVMRESQMPTIVEDKLFPRRTLGADEIQAIRLSGHSSNESPELGPPPVAHFDYEDPVKQASPSARLSSPKVAEDDELPAALSINLETRRKRKDSQPKLEIRRHSILAQSPKKTDAEPSTMLRTGAKRKLADRDLDKPIRPPTKDDFAFSRKTVVPALKSAAQQDGASADSEPAQSIEVQARDVTSTPSKAVRKVLGDKSVNMSPHKVGVSTEKAGKPEADKAGQQAAPRSNTTVPRKRRTSAIPQPSSPPPEEIIDTLEVAHPAEPLPVAELPPKTPALSDFFSPTPSEPSVARPFDEGRAGTPPPGDLSALSMTTDGGTRPSRRARAAVNYTEPSLISKMRRPTKQMVDALTGLQDSRKAISSSTERQSGATRDIIIKSEPIDDDDEHAAWRNLPSVPGPIATASPLSTKSAAESSSDPLTAAADLEHDLEPTKIHGPSAASATISALMAGSRRRRESSQQQELGTDLDIAVRKLEELDVYDFKDSSSPAEGGNIVPSSDATGRATSHRRHSSVPKNLAAGSGAIEFKGPPAVRTLAAAPTVVGAGRSERAASRRRSMQM
ncbi:hypothetical protein LTR78_006412 [Recurvomyces mirabilis]|uniref:Shugoshin n=1 Tax=Recurvomyces mirabilis TaxID=574656 RepID=A0AAE0WLD7_9PEZI|nr:hypothetical protein LTR78_006412 [Recurvomyces mirabilis]KAK5152299.1 hypothetical protein LTS14_008676 [Recurvomyces mirabilis]